MTKENIQDRFLNDLREKKSHVSIFLLSGIKLRGTIDAFDPYVIVLSGDKGSQLVYKHAISTVVPG